jgi:hypothetical protein
VWRACLDRKAPGKWDGAEPPCKGSALAFLDECDTRNECGALNGATHRWVRHTGRCGAMSRKCGAVNMDMTLNEIQ